jgi:hypothetical protein
MSKDIDYRGPEGFEEPYIPQRKQRGCMFYGCLSAVIISLIAAVIIGAGIFTLVRAFRTFVIDFGEDTPQPIAVSVLPEGELKALQDRVKAFQEAIVAEKETPPLELTAAEMNALIDANPDFKGVVSVNFEGDKFRGDIAFPLSKFGFDGKYINGKAVFDVRMDSGLLIITIDQLEVKGKSVDEEAMKNMRLQNLAKDSASNTDNAKIISQLEKIEIKNGKLIITPRNLPGTKKKADEAKAESDKEESKKKAESKKAKEKKDDVKPEPAKKAA